MDSSIRSCQQSHYDVIKATSINRVLLWGHRDCGALPTLARGGIWASAPSCSVPQGTTKPREILCLLKSFSKICSGCKSTIIMISRLATLPENCRKWTLRRLAAATNQKNEIFRCLVVTLWHVATGGWSPFTIACPWVGTISETM